MTVPRGFLRNGDTPLTMEFKSGGGFEMSVAGLGTTSGTYTVDGEKLIVKVEGQTHTFVRDGNCIEEPRQIFGRLCKGGMAGQAKNVSSRNVPAAPAGTWVATNATVNSSWSSSPATGSG